MFFSAGTMCILLLAEYCCQFGVCCVHFFHMIVCLITPEHPMYHDLLLTTVQVTHHCAITDAAMQLLHCGCMRDVTYFISLINHSNHLAMVYSYTMPPRDLSRIDLLICTQYY